MYWQGNKKRSFIEHYEGSFKGKPAKVMKDVHNFPSKISLKKVCANKIVINYDTDFDSQDLPDQVLGLGEQGLRSRPAGKGGLRAQGQGDPRKYVRAGRQG